MFSPRLQSQTSLESLTHQKRLNLSHSKSGLRQTAGKTQVGIATRTLESKSVSKGNQTKTKLGQASEKPLTEQEAIYASIGSASMQHE